MDPVFWVALGGVVVITWLARNYMRWKLIDTKLRNLDARLSVIESRLFGPSRRWNCRSSYVPMKKKEE